MTASDEQRLKELLRQWHKGVLPPHLHEELFHLLEKEETNGAVEAEMQRLWEETESAKVFDSSQKEAMLASVVGRRPAKRLPLRYAAVAAAVLLTIITATGLVLWRQPAHTKPVAVNAADHPAPVTDVAAPATNKAVLTLADGRRILIENSGEGKLATEGEMNVMKAGDGGLVYQGNATEVRWNTLTVPRGSKPIRLTLADGSAVTLNVASSLTYPTAFTANERRVKLTGEAFFEVAKVPSTHGSGKKLFTVSVNAMEVEVTGTKFNVNAYDDEAATKTTLVEGAVNIIAGTQRQVMLPGEQALVEADHPQKIKLNTTADIDEATAWLNGKFRFNNANVEAVMRQVARWYDVDVKYTGRPRLRFGGQIDRGSTLRQMFAILETSGLRFTLRENVVTILP